MSSPIGGGGADPVGPDLAAYLAETEAMQETQGTSQIKKAEKSKIEDTLSTAKKEGVDSTPKQSYTAPPDRPQLAPRVDPKTSPQADAKVSTEQQQEDFLELVESLPPALKEQLIKDMGKPEGKRDPELQALEENLELAAADGQTAEAMASTPKGSVKSTEGKQMPVKGAEGFSGDIGKLLKKGELTSEEFAKLQTMANSPETSPAQKQVLQEKLLQQSVILGSDGEPMVPFDEIANGEQFPTEQLSKAFSGQINPANLGGMDEKMMHQMLGANAISALENNQKVVQATVDALPEGDPNKMVLSDFLKFISDIIGEMKEFLREMQGMDAEQGKKAAIAEKETQVAKLEKQMKAIEKAAKMKKKMKTLNTVMKIAGPVMAVAFLAMAILSGGSLIAIAIAAIGVIVAVIAATTTIIDDVMEQVVDTIVEVFKDMGMSDEMARIMTMIVLILAVVALILVTRNLGMMTKIGGQSLAGGAKVAGHQIGKEVSKQATKKVANSVALNTGVTALQHSKALEVGLKPLLTEVFGMDEETAEIVAMVIQMIVMLTMMMASMQQMGSASSAVLKSATGGPTQSMQNMANTLQTGASAVEAGTQAYSAVANLRLAAMAKEKAEFEAFVAELESSLEVFGLAREDRQQGLEKLNELVEYLSESFIEIVEGMSAVIGDVTQA
ncbi:MAG: hypothetical protein CMP47_15950 [Rickettsiales bacterium]|nr:hypothetical protein [Rickettsiales bacterium]